MQSRWLNRVGMAGLCLAVAMTMAPARTFAQAAETPAPIKAGFKGTLGLGLVGAELGAVIPALAGLDDLWAFLVFPAVGAAGGAVAGYFAIDNPNHVELSVGALALGAALAIPALVITMAFTSYDPGDDEGGAATTARHVSGARLAAAREHRRRVAAGSGMVRLSEGQLALSPPGFALLPSVQRGSTRLAGLSVSLVSGSF